MSTQFNSQKHFYFQLFSLFNQLYIIIQFSVSTVSMSKTFLFRAIQFSQAVLIQLINFSISTDLIYTQLNVKAVLC